VQPSCVRARRNPACCTGPEAFGAERNIATLLTDVQQFARSLVLKASEAGD
jgi:hypothetical protein